jgi:hypothetical protein
MDNLNDIIANLTNDDIENLKAAAQSIFGNSEPSPEPPPVNNAMPDLSALLGNVQMMEKLTRIMGAMNKQDSRADLIKALKPLLSEKRRKRADEAMQLLRLFDLLPMITELMGGDGKNGR